VTKILRLDLAFPTLEEPVAAKKKSKTVSGQGTKWGLENAQQAARHQHTRRFCAC
jgi:hypothetical protein